jgi:hypothetical protein
VARRPALDPLVLDHLALDPLTEDRLATGQLMEDRLATGQLAMRRSAISDHEVPRRLSRCGSGAVAIPGGPAAGSAGRRAS